ncbi:hypothetical protein A4A58_13280 [Tardiphaga robiniae]|uniref:Uncharacterized protein n=1 Tax=Tardiphaga robiniae TaxID=943830 RepID=A0A161QZ07_9BRAD|nr:hypothetical protein A4A58_13280 [Tardiphaga robiniae]
MVPICGTTTPSRDLWSTSDGRRVTSIRVTMTREKAPKEMIQKANRRRAQVGCFGFEEITSFGIPSTDVGDWQFGSNPMG